MAVMYNEWKKRDKSRGFPQLVKLSSVHTLIFLYKTKHQVTELGLTLGSYKV